MFRERESRFFIDCKHIFIERKKADKTQAFVNFITNSLIDVTQKSPLSQQEKKNLETYVQDYVSFVIQKKALLQKELKQILYDALICLRTVMPQLPDIPGPRSPEAKEYDFIIEKNISYLSLFHVKKEVKEHLAYLMENPYELKFYYFTKYNYKEQVIRTLVENELPQILHYLSFHPFTSMGTRDYIVTAEPRAGGYKKHNLIYYSLDTIPIFRKLTFENEMGGFNIATEISCISQLSDTILYVKESQDQSPRRERPVRIGYCFSQKKMMQLQKNNRALTSRYPLEFIPIDLRVPLNKDIQYFFHKISDQTKEKNDPFRDIKVANFEKLKETIPLLDPIDNLDVLSDRRLFQSVVSEIFSSQNFLGSMQKIFESKGLKEINFKVPKIVFVDPKDASGKSAESIIQEESMKYPLVVKTAAACGDKNSHFMAIVLNGEGLKQVQQSDLFKEYSFILQEYIEHDERIYKVYVVGDDFQVGQKQSLPNLTDQGIPNTHFYFDSQISFKDHPEFAKLSKGYEALDVDRDVVHLVSQELNKRLGFSLYGFDLIREGKTGDYYLIDLNYFPGYTNYKDFKEVLHRHFYTIYKNKLAEIVTK